ncbi:protein BONZAI 1-like isoform X1 [Gossypium arboreum]|uniref:protein BONZAI 1-like isoform X1 n=2 Tax=Gossypium arboreum TaxID=29729 RepID=UPI00081963EE|nr:protein BONZAI 1-like isoform X1 [Gossypium arboreum]XP_052883370.1 protein BONZAI 1-like isoform X1 [Gossypium arboreum]
MGNCCSDVGGGMAAVSGAASSAATGNQNDAVDMYLRSHGIHGLFSQIELSFSATSLRDRDVFSKSDPMVVVYIKERDGAINEVFRTEVVLNSLTPTWIAKYTITYHFEVVQNLLFKVFDVDTQYHNVEMKMLKLEEQQSLGEACCILSEIVTKPNRSLTLDLIRREESVSSTHSQHCGKLTVHAEECFSSKSTADIILRCIDLESKDLFSKSVCGDGFIFSYFLFVLLSGILVIFWCKFGLVLQDPFLVISKLVESGISIPVCKTEVLKNDHNPTWKPVFLNIQQVGSKDSPLVIECFNFNSNGKHDLIGKVQKSLADLEKLHLGREGENLYLPTLVGHNYENKILNSKLLVDKFSETAQNTFLDYLAGGFELNFMVAIDFTASNGNPRLPDSLHYIDPSGRLNAYQKAIYEVGEVLQFYDADKRYPAWGFGARPIDGPVSHCFNLNGSSNYCEVQGIQGIMMAYTSALFNVSLAGPTLFGHVINRASVVACDSLSTGAKKYFVLLIITDGVITDLQETKDALVKASDLPLSILIVGVGGADFKEMEILDADKGERLESTTGCIASRDIVQFVPFRDVQGGEISMVGALLAELPTQFLTYMRRRDIKPST